MSTRRSRTGSESSPKTEFDLAFDELRKATTDRTRIPGRDRGVLKWALRSRDQEKQHREKLMEIRVRMAGEIAKTCDRYGRSQVFSKPATLPSFLEIRRTLDRVRLSRKDPDKQPEKTRALIRTYNAWLAVVLSAIGNDTSNVTLLLDTIETLEVAQKGHPLARRVEEHMRETFGVELPDPADWPTKDEVAKRHAWIRSLVHREDVIPMWLIDGLPIPEELDEDEDDEELEADDEDDAAKNGELF
jgi:hypothetical protein